MEEGVEKGEADFIALARPLIHEPGIINAWKNGSRRTSACISCNKCLELIRKKGVLQCASAPRQGAEDNAFASRKGAKNAKDKG